MGRERGEITAVNNIFVLKRRNGMEYLSCVYLRSRHHGSHVAEECVNSPHYSHRQSLTLFCPKIIYYCLNFQDKAEVAGWCVEKNQVTHAACNYAAYNYAAYYYAAYDYAAYNHAARKFLENIAAAR